ncbi:hypothetical protein CANCADRAFT_108032 [Tortispora caseinolytica NRRL Y-17796]|uniref:V-type proton ATPase subunit G n=1 Tax=Tortispora caseinolytica NRRL Y-17796 TaxID=767744 RepID=A0A1E4TFM0_9ASCO|nr:hypothetical protein CANCADRAFT_108032 [Tortispora caseinolytica NRRL Y-17796]
MSAQSSAGIKTLLEAEKEAQEIVQKARAYRTQRLKAARSEAAKEIEEYKKQQEKKFNEFVAQHSGDTTKLESDAAAQVEKEVAAVKEAASKNADKVVDDLVKAILTPAPKLHINA